MEGFSLIASTLCNADQTVVSVGPYTFQILSARDFNLAARSAVNASPPLRMLRRELVSFQSASNSMRHVAGVACIVVMGYLFINWINASASPVCLSFANTTVPPH